jgi:hypothetical protein
MYYPLIFSKELEVHEDDKGTQYQVGTALMRHIGKLQQEIIIRTPHGDLQWLLTNEEAYDLHRVLLATALPIRCVKCMPIYETYKQLLPEEPGEAT